MGFRNPVTSISADDVTPGTLTGTVVQTSAAGRRVVVTDNGPPELTGAPEVGFYTGDASEVWQGRVRSGIAAGGDAGHPIYPDGDTGYLELAAPHLHPTAPGASVVLYGPARGTPLPGQTVDTVAINGGLLVNGQPYARGRAWLFPRTGSNPLDTWAAGTGFVGMIAGTITDAPAGDYLFALTLVLAGSAANTPANVRLSPGALGDPRCDLTTIVRPCTFVTTYRHPGGNLTVDSSVQLLTGGTTGSIYTSGSQLNVVYLGAVT